MTAYWIMFIWATVVGIFSKANSNSDRSLKDNKAYGNTLIKSWMIMLVPVIICACRSGFYDTYSYMREFRSSPPLSHLSSYLSGMGSAKVFYGIQILFYNIISSDPQVWISFIAILQSILLINFINKYSVDVGFSFFLFIANSMMMAWMFNGLKQFFATLVLASFIHFLVKKEYSKYLVVLLFVSGIDFLFETLNLEDPPWIFGGIHQTAIIMIPIIFCVTGKILNKRMIAMLLAVSAILISGLMDSFLELTTENTQYAEDLAYVQADNGMSFFRLAVNLVPVVLILIKKKEIEKSNVNNIVSISINMSVTSALIYLCGSITSGIFVGRLPIYCEIYNLILYPWLFENPYKKEKVWLKPILYICYTIYFYFQIQSFGEPYWSKVLTFLV